MTQIVIEKTSNAYLKDGALILYFDMAQTPFVSRFDLDSLVQANFEVADKKDGFYSLVLRDYTGQAQTIGQFNSKSDAHQALYAILKALLEQPEKTSPKKCGWFWCFFKGALQLLLAIIFLIALLYGILWLRLPSKHIAPEHVPVAQNENVPSAIPEGEAVDADEFLKDVVPQAAPKGQE